MSGDKQALKSTDPQHKPPNPTGSEVHEGNIVPVTLDKLSAEHRQELEQMMSSVKDKFMNSFQQSRKGTIVHKYKLKVVAADEVGPSSAQGDKGIAGEPGDKGGSFQEGMVEDLGPDGSGLQQQFYNFQDRIDYVVQHALINQSGVLVNTLTNMVKTVVDGTVAEHQATRPVYLLGGVFPNYRPLVTGNQQGSSNPPSTQPMAQAKASAPTAPAVTSSGQRQMINPRLLTWEQPQHSGQNFNRLTQEQVTAMFLPNPPAVDPALPSQQTPPRQQITQPIQQQSLLNTSSRLRTPDNQQRHHVATQVVPEHLVHNVQPDQSVIPQIIPEHLVRNIQPNTQNYHGGHLNYHYQPPSPHVHQGGSPQPQFAP
jgi:hypothetical protein